MAADAPELSSSRHAACVATRAPGCMVSVQSVPLRLAAAVESVAARIPPFGPDGALPSRHAQRLAMCRPGVSRSAASAPAQHNIALRKVARAALPSPSRVRVTECYVGRPGLRVGCASNARRSMNTCGVGPGPPRAPEGVRSCLQHHRA